MHEKILRVGDDFAIMWSLVTILLHTYMVIFLVLLLFFRLTVLLYHHLSAFLLLYFIITVAILAVVFCVFVLFIRAKLN